MGAYKEVEEEIRIITGLNSEDILMNELLTEEELHNSLVNEDKICYRMEKITSLILTSKSAVNIDLNLYSNLKEIVIRWKTINYVECDKLAKKLMLPKDKNKYKLKIEVNEFFLNNPINNFSENINLLVKDSIHMEGIEFKKENESISLALSKFPNEEDFDLSLLFKNVFNAFGVLETEKRLIDSIKFNKMTLTDTQIKKIETFCNLTVLIVEKSELDYKCLWNPDELVVLHLENIGLTSLESFPVFSNVSELILDDNNITELNNLSVNFPNLSFLSIKRNKLRKFPNKLSEDLDTIFMQDNIISGVLDCLPANSEVINLSGNEITEVIFEKRQYINEVIDLSHNKITNIKNLKYFKSSNSIYLSYNPIIDEKEKIAKLQKEVDIVILPRIIFDKKEDVIGEYGLIDESLSTGFENSKTLDSIVVNLKYSSSILSSFSSKSHDSINDNKKCILIKGKWGSGKTYFYQNKIKVELENNNYNVLTYTPLLNNHESPFDSILNMIGPKETFLLQFFKEIWKRRILVLALITIGIVINLGVDFYNYKTSFFGSFNLISSVVNSLPKTMFFTVVSLPLSLLQKNDEYLSQLDHLESCCKDRDVVVVIDDLERVKIEKQIEIINAVQTLKNCLHVIVLMDEVEFNKILLSYYGSDFNYRAYMSKIFDLEYDFVNPSVDEYYENNVVIKNLEINSILKNTIKNSSILQECSIRDIKKIINSILNRYLTQDELSEKEIIFEEAYKTIDTKKDEEKYDFVYLSILLRNSSNEESLNIAINKLIDFDFYTVNYMNFDTNLKHKIIEFIISDNKPNINNLSNNNLVFIKIYSVEDVKKFIIWTREVGIFDTILNSLYLNDENELINYIFLKINNKELYE